MGEMISKPVTQMQGVSEKIAKVSYFYQWLVMQQVDDSQTYF